MKIASFNINSVKARLPIFLEWIKNEKPDIICLQEIKCENQNFPTIEIEDMGYNAAIFGQKTYNGVAILSRHPIEDKQEGLPHFTHPLEPQSRYLEALITPKNKPALRVACVYAPNGNPVYDEAGKETEKYQYKLAFHKALTARAKTLLAYEEILIFAGDYNIIPSPQDAYNIKLWEDDALYRLPSRQAFREMLYLGFTDALQARPAPSDTDNNFTDNNSTDNNSTDNNSTDSNSTNSNSTNSNSTNNNSTDNNFIGNNFTFWDYQKGAWERDNGIRIDHFLLSAQALDCLIGTGIDKYMRGEKRPSDHAPLWIKLEI